MKKGQGGATKTKQGGGGGGSSKISERAEAIKSSYKSLRVLQKSSDKEIAEQLGTSAEEARQTLYDSIESKVWQYAKETGQEFKDAGKELDKNEGESPDGTSSTGIAALHDEQEKRYADMQTASTELKKLSGGGKFNMTPDEVKASPAYKEAKAKYAAAEASVRKFNEENAKSLKDIAEYRRSLRSTKDSVFSGVFGMGYYHELPVAIENPKGSIRSGANWSVKMPADYGYVRCTRGADDMQVDCFVGPDPASNLVLVIDQKDLDTGAFDEHKCMLGFTTAEQARACYVAAFSDGVANERIMHATVCSMDDFKKWLASGDLKRPYRGQ